MRIIARRKGKVRVQTRTFALMNVWDLRLQGVRKVTVVMNAREETAQTINHYNDGQFA